MTGDHVLSLMVGCVVRVGRAQGLSLVARPAPTADYWTTLVTVNCGLIIDTVTTPRGYVADVRIL